MVLIKFASSTKVPSISVEHFSDDAQFLNATCVAASSAISSVSVVFLLLTAISPVTKIYASE